MNHEELVSAATLVVEINVTAPSNPGGMLTLESRRTLFAWLTVSLPYAIDHSEPI